MDDGKIIKIARYAGVSIGEVKEFLISEALDYLAFYNQSTEEIAKMINQEKNSEF
jgi:DNA-binding transcriptional MerR regulator